MLLGPSGCGKSSLLRLVGGLIGAHTANVFMQGSITVNGMLPEMARIQKTYGMAFQNPTLLQWRNAAENVRLAHEINHVVDDGAIQNTLKLVGLDGFGDTSVKALSGGMQQRVNLARAFVHHPPILLLDEPFGGLDEITRDMMNDLLLSLQRRNRQSVLLVTHSLREAAFLADRVIVLSKRPAEILSDIPSPLERGRDSSARATKAYLDFVDELRQLILAARR